MFDKIIIGDKSEEHIPYVKTINIGRAPTDESIKLCDEFKEKAYKSILESMQHTDNTFSFNAIVYQDANSFNKKLKYEFMLNGKAYSSEIAIDRKHVGNNYIEYVEKIYNDLAKQIAMFILKCSIKDLKKGV